MWHPACLPCLLICGVKFIVAAMDYISDVKATDAPQPQSQFVGSGCLSLLRRPARNPQSNGVESAFLGAPIMPTATW